jgi:hypothetical protein
MHHDEHDYEDETLSLTREQIRVLRGRKLADLDVRERLEYANAAPRPLPANKQIPEEHRFRISPRLLEGADPRIKLEVANGADRMSRIRQRMSNILAELAVHPDSDRKHALEHERTRLSEEGRQLFSRIGKYEDRATASD